MKYTKQQLIEAYKKLSEQDRELFMAIETSEAVWAVAKKFNLSPTQKNDLVDLTTFAIFKLDPLEGLIENISRSLGVEPNTALAIKDELILVISRFDNYKKTGFTSSSNSQTIPSNLVDHELIEKSASGIADRLKLTEDQKIKLIDVIDNVLSGRVELSRFRSNLVNELNISYDQALKISFDVNSEIFNPVMDDLKNLNGQPEQVTTSETKKSEENYKSQPDINPGHLITDHEEMERVDGPHLHSQSVMPKTSQSAGNFMSATKKSFGSIVEQKLSGIVGSNSTKPQTPVANPPTQKPTSSYNGNDPYREPIE